MLKRKNNLFRGNERVRSKKFSLVLVLFFLALLFMSHGKWTGRVGHNPEIAKKSLAGFGLHELFRSETEVFGMLTYFHHSTMSSEENLKLSDGSQEPANVIKRSFGKKIQAKNFQSVTVDDNNVRWFITEAGVVSFNGKKWSLHNRNKQVPGSDLRDMAYLYKPAGRHLLLASPEGATLAALPVGKKNPADTYTVDNSPLLSNNVISVALGRNSIAWIGTDKGISAVRNNEWLDYDYRIQYPEELFKNYPITALATSTDGDSLYAATAGVGVVRVFRNNVDAISGASEYAQWGPIYLPSDNVYSIYIAPDDTQWFGTDMGVARHVGHNTLANWTVFDTDDGLVNNFVQAIAADNEGRLWFGTKGGVSVYDGSNWISFTENNGLTSNNVLCIAVDKGGVVWIGTDNGVTSVRDGEFTQYN